MVTKTETYAKFRSGLIKADLSVVDYKKVMKLFELVLGDYIKDLVPLKTYNATLRSNSLLTKRYAELSKKYSDLRTCHKLIMYRLNKSNGFIEHEKN